MEKKTSLSGSTAWYGLGNLFVRSVSFILLPLYSNLISASEFGNYSLIMSMYALVAVFYQFGMQSALFKFYLQEKETARRKTVFSSIFNTAVILSLLITAAGVVFSSGISKIILNTSRYSNLIILTFITLFVETAVYFVLQLLKTKENSKRVVLYSSVSAVFNLLLNLLLVYFLQWGIEGIITAQLISSSLVFVLMISELKGNLEFSINNEIIKKVLIFSIPLVAAGLLSSAVDVIDRFILDHFLGKHEVGIYSFSYRIALAMNVFVIAFRTAWTPHSLNFYYSNDYKLLFGKTLTKLTAAGGFIFLVILLFANDLFKIHVFNYTVFNPAYEAGLVILPFVLAGYFFSGIVSFFSVYPYVSNKSYHFLISDILAFVFNFILNFILIPLYGLAGAALSTAIAFLVAALYLFSISYGKIKIKYEPGKLISIVLSVSVITYLGFITANFWLDVILLAAYLVVINFAAGIKIKKLLRFGN